MHLSWRGWALLIVLAFSLTGTVGYHAWTNRSGVSNLYVHQAQAFLNGRLSVPESAGVDVAYHAGRYFVPFPPFPAALLIPFVAVLGPAHTNVVVIALALTALCAWFMLRILTAFGLTPRDAWLAAMAFFLGTGYWSALMISHGVHYFAQIVAVTALLGAVAECFHRQRPWLVASLWGCAFLSRQCMLFSWFFLAALIFGDAPAVASKRAIRVLVFALLSAVPVLVYLLYNEARFGSPFDTGYSRIVLEDGFLKERVQRYGIFSIRYVPVNFLHLFLQGFSFSFSGPMLMSNPVRDAFGTSITFASPFLLFAVRARWDRIRLLGAWISVILGLIVVLTYHTNGWVQINTQRYTLDFVPILFLLAVRSLPRASKALWTGAIVYSVALNVVALLIFPVLSRLL